MDVNDYAYLLNKHAPVGAWLASDSAREIAIAGKPGSYRGFWLCQKFAFT